MQTKVIGIMQMSVLDIILIVLGATTVVVYLIFSIIKFKKEKNNPNANKQKGANQKESKDIIDYED